MNKRLPAGLLALCMAAGLMPGTAFAQEGQHTHNAGGWTCTAVTEETLACTQPEHTHGEGCYDAAGALGGAAVAAAGALLALLALRKRRAQ